MRVEPPDFAGRDSPSPLAVCLAAAFGLATLVASALAPSGPGSAEALLARGVRAAALSILAGAAVSLLGAFSIAWLGAAWTGAKVRAMLRALPRGRARPDAAVLFFVLGAVVCAPAFSILSVPVGIVLESFGFEPEPQFAARLFAMPEAWPVPAAAMAFSVVAVAPLAEEILYRALLWQGLCAVLRRRFPDGLARRRADAAAALACAVFFAVIHFSLWAFAPLALFALVLSAVYRRFSLGCAVALHAGFNAGGCTLALFAAAF